jgi:hypothetical protein
MPRVIGFKRPRLFALSTLLLIFKPWENIRQRLIASIRLLKKYVRPAKRSSATGELIQFKPRLHHVKNQVKLVRTQEGAVARGERICLP